MTTKMIAERTLSIIHFEDDEISRALIRKLFSCRYNAKVISESTLINLEFYKNSGLLSNFDFIICDYCFKGEDITPKLEMLARLNKTVVFNTCLEYSNFYSKVYSKLGEIPNNFLYTRKGNIEDLETLYKEVEKHL